MCVCVRACVCVFVSVSVSVSVSVCFYVWECVCFVCLFCFMFSFLLVFVFIGRFIIDIIWNCTYIPITCYMKLLFQTVHVRWYIFPTTARCYFKAANFQPNPHKVHPISRPWGRDMWSLLWIQHLKEYLPQSLPYHMLNHVMMDRAKMALDYISHNTAHIYDVSVVVILCCTPPWLKQVIPGNLEYLSI